MKILLSTIKNTLILEKTKKRAPGKYFYEKLCLEDFNSFNDIILKSNINISWSDLINNSTYEIRNKKLLWIRLYKDLNLIGTELTKLEYIKEVSGRLNLHGIKIISLGILEKVGGDLILIGTPIENLGELKIVGKSLYLNGNIKNLSCLERVGSDLHAEETDINIQLEIIEKINDGSLYVGKNVMFGGGVSNIESLLRQEYIPGSLNLQELKLENLGNVKKIKGFLNISGTSIRLQLYVIDRIKNGSLVVGGDIYMDNNLILAKYFKNDSLNYKLLDQDFGNDINEVNDKQTREIYKELLRLDYLKLLSKIKDCIKEINNEDDIIKFNNHLQRIKGKMQGFGLQIEQIDISDIIR